MNKSVEQIAKEAFDTQFPNLNFKSLNPLDNLAQLVNHLNNRVGELEAEVKKLKGE